MGFVNLDCTVFIPTLQYLYWICMILSAFAAVVVPEIRKWHRYGKLREKTGKQEETETSWLDEITVPKRWFIFFYVLGIVWTSFLLFTRGNIVRIALELTVCEEGTASAFEAFHPLPMQLYLIHLGRRFIEEWLSPPSQAQMHLAGFLVGATFYGFIPLALASSVSAMDVSIEVFGAGVSIFALGNWHQFKCHQILRRLRREGAGSGYGFPRGDWFQWSSSPHYLAEIVIYSGLAVICKSSGTLPLDLVLGIVFTTLNLCVTGARTHQWYLERFGDEYKKERRWKVIPFVF